MKNLEKLYSLVKDEPLDFPWRRFYHYLDKWLITKAIKDCARAGCKLGDDNVLFSRLVYASAERTKRIALRTDYTPLATQTTEAPSPGVTSVATLEKNNHTATDDSRSPGLDARMIDDSILR